MHRLAVQSEVESANKTFKLWLNTALAYILSVLMGEMNVRKKPDKMETSAAERASPVRDVHVLHKPAAYIKHASPGKVS